MTTGKRISRICPDLVQNRAAEKLKSFGVSEKKLKKTKKTVKKLRECEKTLKKHAKNAQN